MPQQKSAPTNNWATLLQESLQDKRILPTGEKWQTAREIAVDFRITAAAVPNKLRPLVAAGKVEVFEGMDFNGDGRLVRRVWYRPKI